MPSITVRVSDSERIILENLAGGDISKYIRNVAFGNGRRQAESINWLENRVEDLLENQAVLLETVRALAAEVRELKVAPPPQPIAAPPQDNSRLEGMTLELLLMLRGRLSPTDRRRIQATVESEGLQVWESSDPPSSFMTSNTTERQPQTEVERPTTSPAKEDRSFISKAKGWLG